MINTLPFINRNERNGDQCLSVVPSRRLDESASQWQLLAQLSRTKDSRPKPLSLSVESIDRRVYSRVLHACVYYARPGLAWA